MNDPTPRKPASAQHVVAPAADPDDSLDIGELLDPLRPGRDPLAPPRMPVLRRLLRRALRKRAPDARLSVVEESRHVLMFRLVQGGWITARTYMLDVSDDGDDAIDVLTQALADLEVDQRRYPAVSST
jgi:hypothetical protein